MSDRQHILKFQLSFGFGLLSDSVNPAETFEWACSAFDGTPEGRKEI